MVPLQIARAESEAFVILKDGLREDVRDFGRLSELAEFISFGLYEVILETNENPVVVISSMGKQSTGKSYMLNHLAGEVSSRATSLGLCQCSFPTLSVSQELASTQLGADVPNSELRCVALNRWLFDSVGHGVFGPD